MFQEWCILTGHSKLLQWPFGSASRSLVYVYSHVSVLVQKYFWSLILIWFQGIHISWEWCIHNSGHLEHLNLSVVHIGRLYMCICVSVLVQKYLLVLYFNLIPRKGSLLPYKLRMMYISGHLEHLPWPLGSAFRFLFNLVLVHNV